MKKAVPAWVVYLSVFAFTSAFACEDELKRRSGELSKFGPVVELDDVRQACATSEECTEKVRKLRAEIEDWDWPKACDGKDAIIKIHTAKFLEKTEDFEEEVGFFDWLFGDDEEEDPPSKESSDE